jgi:diguanylate cyclase (GGDEF)-like protein
MKIDIIEEFSSLTKTLKLLYIENNNLVRTTLNLLLREFFVDITVVFSMDDALDKLSEGEFDLIFFNISHGVSELDLINNIKLYYQKVPLIGVVSKISQNQFEEFVKAGVDGYVLDPLDFKQFVTALRGIVNSIIIKKENSNNKKLIELYIEKQRQTTGENVRILKNEYYINNITGLPNRTALLRDMGDCKNPVTLFLVDIKQFKRINDLYGISVGDLVLKRFAGYLAGYSEDFSCTVYHISGDEFALLFKDSNGLDECNYRAKMLVFYTFNRKCVVSELNKKIETTLKSSIGIAFDEIDPLQKANMALNHAKETDVPYSIYSSEFKDDLVKNEAVISMVKHCLDMDNVVPYFQPIVTTDGEVKYEVLMRLDTPGGIVSPFKFLDIAKKSGYYTALTKSIIEKSFKMLQNRGVSFSINLSYQDAANKNLVEFLKEKIEEFDVANLLILEIVESESIENFSIMKDFLTPFKEMGVRVAIDDFGSGYSNFSYLLELKPDFIKIDGSIIKNIDHDERSLLIASTIVNFSKSLGLKTIAEFIHNREVYEKAKSIGVDAFQGYYLGKPAPTPEDISFSL